MGYSKLIQKRKEQAECAVGIEASRHDVLPQSDAPVFGASFATIVSGITGLVGSLFFVHKWFKCLNYLIGRNLFKASVLTGVWALLIGMSVFSVWLESSWLLVFMWIGRIALGVYLLLQLRRCKACKSDVVRSIKIRTGILYALWILGLLFIWRCGSVRMWQHAEDSIFGLIILAVFVLIEVSLIQKIFNLVVCDAAVNRDALATKIAGDWYRLKIAVVCGAIALSIVLFFWDIIATIVGIIDYGSGYYHGLDLDGKFHFWLFCEGYSPHAGLQLCLWLLAALIALSPSGCVEKFVIPLRGMFNKKNRAGAVSALRGSCSVLFPDVTKQKECMK